MATHKNRTWWNLKDKAIRQAPHESFIPLVREIQRTQEGRYRVMRRLMAIYEYGNAASTSPTNNAKRLNEEKLYFNAAQNGIDTLHAQIITPRVAPMPLTEGGTWTQRNSAKTIGKALEGEFEENDVDRVTEDVVLDGLLAGYGLAKVYQHAIRCRIERVNPTDVFVDETESRDGAPRCFYERRAMDRYVALDCFGGSSEDGHDLFGSSATRYDRILAAPPAKSEGWADTNVDRIEVWEGWHLPSGPNSSDGVHIIAIEGCTLLCEPFEYDNFPFAVYVPKRPREGWHGLPVMRNYAAAQREFEKIGRRLQLAHHRMGGTHILANKASQCTQRDFDNGQGTIVEYVGNVPPTEWNPTPANPQTYEYWQMVARMALEFDGQSQLAAQSQVPAGLQQASGKALQTFQDSESKRKVAFHRARERFVVDLSKRIIDVWRKLAEQDPNYSVRYVQKGSFEKIKIKDALEWIDDCVIKVFPVSQLSQNPPAKFAQLEQLLNVGAITVEQFKRLYDLPDIAAETEVDCADYEIIDKNLDYILFKGKPVVAEPFDDLQLILARGGKFYNYCRRMDGIPEDRLRMIRDYIASAKNLQDRIEAEAQARAAEVAASQPQPASPPMGGMMPPGMMMPGQG